MVVTRCVNEGRETRHVRNSSILASPCVLPMNTNWCCSNVAASASAIAAVASSTGGPGRLAPDCAQAGTAQARRTAVHATDPVERSVMADRASARRRLAPRTFPCPSRSTRAPSPARAAIAAGRSTASMPVSARPGARMPDSTAARLFDPEALAVAAQHAEDSHYRWLATSDDPEAASLRAALERCFRLAGARGGELRKALQHERWGQHVGAIGHLLTLGLLASQGWKVASEPDLEGQSPDILAIQGDVRALVEVRAITGAGSFPWEQRRATGRGLTPDAREALSQNVMLILQRKADIYRPLVRKLAGPYVIALYQDKDSEISGIARELLYGRTASLEALEPRDPAGGAFGDEYSDLGHVSAVMVFGRVDTPGGELLLWAELLENPYATSPLPPTARFAGLRRYALDPATTPPRVRWRGLRPPPFGVGA